MTGAYRRAPCTRCSERPWDWAQWFRGAPLRFCRPCLEAVVTWWTEHTAVKPTRSYCQRCGMAQPGAGEVARIALCIPCLREVLREWKRKQ